MFPLLSLGCQILFKPSDYQSFRNLALQQPHSVHVNDSVKQSSLLNFRAFLGTDSPSEIFTFREICQSDFGACLFVVQSRSLGFCGPPGCCTCDCCEKVFFVKAYGLSWFLENTIQRFHNLQLELSADLNIPSHVSCQSHSSFKKHAKPKLFASNPNFVFFSFQVRVSNRSLSIFIDTQLRSGTKCDHDVFQSL